MRGIYRNHNFCKTGKVSLVAGRFTAGCFTASFEACRYVKNDELFPHDSSQQDIDARKIVNSCSVMRA